MQSTVAGHRQNKFTYYIKVAGGGELQKTSLYFYIFVHTMMIEYENSNLASDLNSKKKDTEYRALSQSRKPCGWWTWISLKMNRCSATLIDPAGPFMLESRTPLTSGPSRPLWTTLMLEYQSSPQWPRITRSLNHPKPLWATLSYPEMPGLEGN